MVISSLTSYYRVNLFKSPNASNSNNAWNVNSGGYANDNNNVNNQNGVRPAAYLSSNVQIIGGDGDTVPYKLKS